MSTTKKVEQLIIQMENYLECWDGLERKFDGTPGIK